MSARAAWRLEELGFGDVYDYRGGMVDWVAAGLGHEGQAAAIPTAGDLARVDVPSCSPSDTLGEVRARADDICVVTNEEGIALGVLKMDEAAGHEDDDPVGEIMEVLPYAKRPSADVESLVAQLDETGLDHVLLTTPEGRFIGALYKDDARQAMAER